MTSPCILEIKGNALDDGPGIRTVVFFKGCPLACRWCHNPEGQSPAPEIGFEADRCVGCDTCLGVCPEGALSRDNPFFVDRGRCTLCFACAEACPSGALSRVGRPMTVERILAAITPDIPFFETSGGGVTLSGGEPTLDTAFLSALLAALKARGLHTLVETCGCFDLARFKRRVLPWTDALFYDLKLIDCDAHRHWCGVSNDGILRNLEQLAATDAACDLLVRVPLVPGITATAENLAGIAAFLRAIGLQRAQVMPYHPLWAAKCAKLGVPNPLHGLPGMATWMPGEAVAACRAIFHAAGIQTL